MAGQWLDLVVTVGRGLGDIAAREICERVPQAFGLSRVEGKVFFSVGFSDSACPHSVANEQAAGAGRMRGALSATRQLPAHAELQCLRRDLATLRTVERVLLRLPARMTSGAHATSTHASAAHEPPAHESAAEVSRLARLDAHAELAGGEDASSDGGCNQDLAAEAQGGVNTQIAAILRLFAPCAAGRRHTPLPGPTGQAGARDCGGAGGGVQRGAEREGVETTPGATGGAIHVAAGHRCRRKRKRSCPESVHGGAGVGDEVQMRGRVGGVQDGGCGQELARVLEWVRCADLSRDLRVRCRLTPFLLRAYMRRCARTRFVRHLRVNMRAHVRGAHARKS